MLTLDTAKIAEHKFAATVEKTHEMLVDAEKQDIKRESIPFTPDAGRDVTSAESQMGRPMHVKAVMKLLSKVNRNFHFEVARADKTKMGIYLLTRYKLPGMKRQEDKMFITGMENGLMPEYSLLEAEVKAIPDPTVEGGTRFINSFKGEKRGWKTVLATLLKKGLITPYQCDTYFKTELGQESGRWHQFMHSPINMISEEVDLGGEQNGTTGNTEQPEGVLEQVG